VLAALVLSVYRTRAALFVLVNYMFILVTVYGVLTYLTFSYKYNVDYHLAMSLYTLMFLALVIVTVKKHGLLKFSLALNLLLHGVMVLKEPMQQMSIISPSAYTVIYNSYPGARILIVSLQIMGLVIHGDRTHRRSDDINNRIRSSVRRMFDGLRVHSFSLLRVKRS
jgi:hypothetical protein